MRRHVEEGLRTSGQKVCYERHHKECGNHVRDTRRGHYVTRLDGRGQPDIDYPTYSSCQPEDSG